MSESLRFGPFWDGVADAYADPLAVRRLLDHALGDWDAVLRAYDAGLVLDREGNPVLDAAGNRQYDAKFEPQRFEATEKLLAAARLAFGLAPFDRTTGKGATEDDCLTVLFGFLGWIEDVKKKPGPTPSAPPPTATPPCVSPSVP